jgi:hypothetical protein
MPLLEALWMQLVNQSILVSLYRRLRSITPLKAMKEQGKGPHMQHMLLSVIDGLADAVKLLHCTA